MTGTNEPDKNSRSGSDSDGERLTDKELSARTRKLETALSGKRKNRESEDGKDTGSSAGYAQAMRLSSEFIAGIVVGAFIGWLIDQFAGTSPWGMIVFLFFGFCAGVLNALRSAGLVAEQGTRAEADRQAQPDRRSDDPR